VTFVPARPSAGNPSAEFRSQRNGESVSEIPRQVARDESGVGRQHTLTDVEAIGRATLSKICV